MCVLAVFYWDSSKFWLSRNILGFQLNLSWYGLTFSLGIFVSVFLAVKFFKEFCFRRVFLQENFEPKHLEKIIDDFIFLFILSIVIGARIGYVCFYGLPYYLNNPIAIFKIWEGGLSSHGAILGLFLISSFFVRSMNRYILNFNFFCITDIIAVTFGFAAFMIRVGNWFNQEIVGTPTSLPWGVSLNNPVDGVSGVFLHPVQLYEGFGYLVLFITLFLGYLFNKNCVGRGFLTAWACIGVSLIRFGAEFFKSPQGMFLTNSSIFSMGQLLSVPLFLFGIGILVRSLFIKKKLKV